MKQIPINSIAEYHKMQIRGNKVKLKRNPNGRKIFQCYSMGFSFT